METIDIEKNVAGHIAKHDYLFYPALQTQCQYWPKHEYLKGSQKFLIIYKTLKIHSIQEAHSKA